MFVFLPLNSLAHLVYDLLSLLMILIFVDIVLSYVIMFGKVSRYHPLIRFVRNIVDPVVNPIRRLLPPPHKTGNLDFAPMVAMILIQVVKGALI